MPRKLSGPHLAALDSLRDRCRLIIDFFAEEGGMGAESEELRSIVEKAFSERNLGRLRAVRDELRQWMTALPDHQLATLEQTLARRFGPELSREQKQREQKIRGVLERGEVRTETEYRLVLEYLEEIVENPTRHAEVEKLNDALAKYS